TLNDYRRQNTVFSHLVEYTQNIFTLVGQGEPYQANVGIVSSDFFDMLGVQPQLGRGFMPEDAADGAQATLLLSYNLWRSRFGADPAVVGCTLEMSNILYRVIGVLPALPPWPHANDVWILPANDPFRVFSVVDAANNRASGYILHVFGKLRAGLSL